MEDKAHKEREIVFVQDSRSNKEPNTIKSTLVQTIQ